MACVSSPARRYSMQGRSVLFNVRPTDKVLLAGFLVYAHTDPTIARSRVDLELATVLATEEAWLTNLAAAASSEDSWTALEVAVFQQLWKTSDNIYNKQKQIFVVVLRHACALQVPAAASSLQRIVDASSMEELWVIEAELKMAAKLDKQRAAAAHLLCQAKGGLLLPPKKKAKMDQEQACGSGSGSSAVRASGPQNPVLCGRSKGASSAGPWRAPAQE
jgi:hypothetical protein